MENQSAGAADIVVAPATRTVKVIVRHSPPCKDKSKGDSWQHCDCPKYLRIYEGAGPGSNRRISANTRSWTKAEKLVQEQLDLWNPDKQELKRLKAEKERKEKRIEEAVAAYIEYQIGEHGDNGTVAMIRSLLGAVDPKTKTLNPKRPGHLFNWLDSLPKRINYISDFLPEHLTSWRANWKFGSDLTKAQRWRMLRGFFSFCDSQGWLKEDPCRKLKGIKADKRNRTGYFTDEQYAAILDAVPLYDPENVPAETRKAWQQRMTAFIELLRWAGMALVDAVQFRPEWVKGDVLRYTRHKTKESACEAVVVLPERLLRQLRNIPLERNSVSADQPFRSKDIKLLSDTAKWNRRLCTIFKLAGITEVQTKVGRVRKPHPHMLRDTFAIALLRSGAPLHIVSKALGHANTVITERHYLPWVDELRDVHVAEVRQAVAKQLGAKPSRRGRA